MALMLDAAGDAIDEGRLEDARKVLDSVRDRHRETIRTLRDLSFNLEPVVLRDHGFEAAVRELAEQLGLSERIQIDLDVAAGEQLAEKAQAALYQVVREALGQAVRRGSVSRISVRVERLSEIGRASCRERVQSS